MNLLRKHSAMLGRQMHRIRCNQVARSRVEDLPPDWFDLKKWPRRWL